MKIIIAALLCSTLLLSGCRNVIFVSDSLLYGSNTYLFPTIQAGGDNVYIDSVNPGTTVLTNSLFKKAAKSGISPTYGVPDTVVMSFGSNESGNKEFSIESYFKALENHIEDFVAVGATCIVMLESTHSFLGQPGVDPRFTARMTEWFSLVYSIQGKHSLYNRDYEIRIASIRKEVEATPGAYLGDYIHLNKAGQELARVAISEQVKKCPKGRWTITNGNIALKEGETAKTIFD
jgi:hypothetical protein